MSIEALDRTDSRYDFSQLAHNALDDIVDITQTLMQHYTNSSAETNPTAIVAIAPQVKALVEAQRFIHRNVSVTFVNHEVHDNIRSVVERPLFKRLLSNLINNAVESIDHNDGKILVSLRTVNNLVKLTISDNGCGISESDIKTILHTGKRIGKEHLGKMKGHGLGLSSAKEWLAKWHGELTIESVVDSGTCITITLPQVLRKTNSFN